MVYFQLIVLVFIAVIGFIGWLIIMDLVIGREKLTIEYFFKLLIALFVGTFIGTLCVSIGRIAGLF